MPTPEDITRHHDVDPTENPWVHGAPRKETIEVVDYDPGWPATYDLLRDRIEGALGEVVLGIEHVGSTSVPGLAAKPVIDIDLTVADPADEGSYVPALEAIGYDLTVREPSWHQHRCLRLDEPRANLHVFAPDCPETIRMLMFRDWLRTHPDDRELYERAKRSALGGDLVPAYNRRKEPVVREIYDRIFRAAGLLG